MCQIIACFILTILFSGDYVKFVLIKVREWPIFACLKEAKMVWSLLAARRRKI